MNSVEISTEPARHSRFLLFTCLVVGLVVRLAWTLHLPTDEPSLAALPDQLEYLHLAQHLLATGTLFFHDVRFDQDVFSYRTPGYPALIALCGASIRITRLLQALIDTSSILAVYLLARTWLSRRTSLLAGLMISLNPWLIYFAGLLLGETLFAAMLVWGMMLMTRRRWWIGTLILALSVYVRPSAVLLPAALACAFLFPRTVREPSTLRLIRRNILALVLTVAVLFPWAIRNHERLGAWVWLTTNGGITLYDGFNPAADGSSNQSFIRNMPWLSSMSELQRDRYFRQQAIAFMRSRPAESVRLIGRKILRTWSPIPLSESYRSNARFIAVGAAYSIPLFVLTLVGLWRGSLNSRAMVLLLIPAIYITLVHATTVGSLRYRIPADVPLAVIAASALQRRAARQPAGETA